MPGTNTRRIPAVAMAVFLAGCMGSQAPAVEGRFEFSMDVPMAFETDRRNESLLGASTLPEAVAFLNSQLRLPQEIPVKYILCDRANAFWNPANQTIEVCHQLGAFLLPRVRATLTSSTEGDYDTQAELDRAVMGITLNAIRFILYHEVGHALVQLYDLPVTGREEDVADQFATWMVLRDSAPGIGTHGLTRGQEHALSGAVGFVAFARSETISSSNRIDWAQYHSFDLERAYNVLCWVYGSTPSKLTWLTPSPTQAERLHVPPEREPWCNYEYQRIDYSFSTLLQQHLRAR